MTPDLQLMMVPDGSIGYGRMGVEIDRQIRALGYTVSNDIDGDPAGTVLHCSTPAHLMKYRQGQRLICMTMFESMHLPEAFREAIHLFDLVLVPSMQNVELFSDYHDNVRFVPLGIDPDVWKPTRRMAPVRRFNFLIGGSGPRKGVDLAYRAFRAAFPDGSWDGPEPWLTFKSPRPVDFFGDRVAQINGRIPADEEVALYESAHVYLQPSRGEGFGLQPLQALAQALPTILTNAHGQASFAEYGYPIDAELTATKTGSFMYGEAGDWWEPDLDQLVYWMRECYDNYEDTQEYAWKQAERVHERFTWNNTARLTLECIGELKPYTGSGEWMVPTVKKYRTILNRPHAAEVAGRSFRWEAGVVYYELADVKRILFEGGFLDPDCVYGDSGLTDEQIARAGEKTGAHAVCPSCHQQLNTRPTAADLTERGDEWVWAAP